MVRKSAPGALFDIAPMPTMTQIVPEDTIDAAPPTKRLKAVDLARCLAAMNVDEETRPSTDDAPTVEALAPPVPAGVPSPLGEDAAVAPRLAGIDDPDARRAQRSVLASWTISAAIMALFTLLAMTTHEPAPDAASHSERAIPK
jgi:hypothetical protein